MTLIYSWVAAAIMFLWMAFWFKRKTRLCSSGEIFVSPLHLSRLFHMKVTKLPSSSSLDFLRGLNKRQVSWVEFSICMSAVKSSYDQQWCVHPTPICLGKETGALQRNQQEDRGADIWHYTAVSLTNILFSFSAIFSNTNEQRTESKPRGELRKK